MNGPTTLPPQQYISLPTYDPVHDISLSCQGSQTWIYNFHYNKAVSVSNPTSFGGGTYGNAVDTRRGIYYVHCGGSQVLYAFDPDAGSWSQVSSPPPCNPAGSSGNNTGVNHMAYDPVHDVMLALIGFSGTATWIMNGATKAWQQASPSGPVPQITGRMAYNAALNMFMLLGGEGTSISRGGGTRGIWLYRYSNDQGAWNALATAPGARIDMTGGSVAISWDDLSGQGVTGYNVYRGTAQDYPKNYTKLNSSPVTGTSYNDATATSATRYAYRVVGVKGVAEGRFSRVLYTCPGRPLGVRVSVETVGPPSQVIVSWYANPEPDIVGYNVYRAQGPGIFASSMTSYARLTGSPVNAVEYTDNIDLSDGVARGYVVKAVNAFGLESGPSPASTTFPDHPIWAWAFPSGANFVLRWQPPERTKVTGIELYRTANPLVHINTSLVTDTVSTWPLPPPTGTDGASLQGKCYVLRARNVLGQMGYATDQISPVNTEFGFGIPIPAMQFKYSDYLGSAVEGGGPAPAAVKAGELLAWPNPFNPAVNLFFSVRADQNVRLRVFDMAGRQVRITSVQARKGPQAHKLDFTGLPFGLYAVRVDADNVRLSKKVIYVR
jgi:hypothetical protein